MEVIAGPDKDRHEHVEEFKKFQKTKTSGKFSEVQLWGSSEGIQKRVRLADIRAEQQKPEQPKQSNQPKPEPKKESK